MDDVNPGGATSDDAADVEVRCCPTVVFGTADGKGGGTTDVASRFCTLYL